VKVFGISLQDCKTIIYCVLIIVVINFRTEGILGERELDTKLLGSLFRKKADGSRRDGHEG